VPRKGEKIVLKKDGGKFPAEGGARKKLGCPPQKRSGQHGKRGWFKGGEAFGWCNRPPKGEASQKKGLCLEEILRHREESQPLG